MRNRKEIFGGDFSPYTSWTMNAWSPFQQDNSNDTEESNMLRNVEGAPSNENYNEIPRTSQIWELVGKEINNEQTVPLNNSAPLMSAAAVMAQSFFTGESSGTTSTPLNSLLNAAAVSDHQEINSLEPGGFTSLKHSPTSSDRSELSASSPHQNYLPPSEESGYAQGYLMSKISTAGTPNIPSFPSLPLPQRPALVGFSQQPPLHPPQLGYSVDVALSTSNSITETNTSRSVGESLEQIWPWMTVVGEYPFCCGTYHINNTTFFSTQFNNVHEQLSIWTINALT